MDIIIKKFRKAIGTAISIFPFPKPKLLVGEGVFKKLPIELAKHGVNKKVFIAIDTFIYKSGLLNEMLEVLDRASIEYKIYDGILPDAQSYQIESAVKSYLENGYEGIIAIGGGSVIDFAKGLGILVKNQGKSLADFKGYFKVRKATAPLFAIPTTAGTGSEATMAVIVTDSKTHTKYPIYDYKIVPKLALLEPNLILSLPPYLTAATGIDVLTHAIEAYLGVFANKNTNEWAKKAIKKVYLYLEVCYKDGSNVEARKEMLEASYYAGLAVGTASVSNIHALAHALGGMYGLQHGETNGILLTTFLEYYNIEAYEKLAQLAKLVGIGRAGDTSEQLAKKFIISIKDMKKRMNIPRYVEPLKLKDFDEIAKRAKKEAVPMYPGPTVMRENEFKDILSQVLKED